MFKMTTDNKDEVTLDPSYGCISSPTLDLSQLIFFKSDDAFAQTFVAQAGQTEEKKTQTPTISTDDGKVTWN